MFSSVKLCRAAALWIFVWMAGAGLAHAQSPLPAPWANQDIGAPAIAGSATLDATLTVSIKAAGADIWGTSDQFHFAYVPVSGNVDIRARVGSIAPTSTWAKTGVMIRAALTPGAAHAFALVSSAKGLAFQRRPTSGGLSLSTAGELAGAPRWVRLVRIGSLVTSYSSADGVTWTTIGSETIQLGATAYVGLAATSRSVAAAGISTVSQVAMSVPSTLPDGQANADIGGPALPGSTTFTAGTYTVVASGIDIWNTADQFHYVYQQVSGDLDVKVRIASITYADRWSKAGVMIRGSLDADSAHAAAFASAGRGYAFQRRSADGAISVGTSGTTAAPPGWVRLKRSGNLITAYQSADGVTWTTIGSDSIALGDEVYVGIAATSHTPLASTTVKADNFSFVQTAPPPPPPVNAPPVVSLATGATSFTAPATITLTAAASDPEGQMARVQFYSGTTLLATDTAAPYSFSWTNVPAGTYAVRAVAYDTAGASGSSATVTLVVGAVAALPPTTVVFTQSPEHATKVTSYLLEIFANGANPETATPVATSDLGKPAPAANGDITVNRATLFSGLAPGTYLATVSSVGTGGKSRSAAMTFTR